MVRRRQESHVRPVFRADVMENHHDAGLSDVSLSLAVARSQIVKMQNDEQKKANAVIAAWDIGEWGIIDGTTHKCAECKELAIAFIRSDGCDITFCHEHWLQRYRLKRPRNWRYAGRIAKI